MLHLATRWSKIARGGGLYQGRASTLKAMNCVFCSFEKLLSETKDLPGEA